MCPPISLPLLLLGVLPGVFPYGFRNCIQSPQDPGTFRCIQRFLESPSDAVTDLPSTATSLNMSHNLLQRLPPASFTRLPHLLTLDLSRNRLAQVAPGAFTGLGALGTLDLSHNHLAALVDGVFTGLANVTLLRLDRNPVSSITPGALVPLRNLHRLLLRGARLCSLGPVAAAVRALPALRLLDLCGNVVSTLGPGTVLPSSLLSLRLCNNSLRGLVGGTPGLFLGLKVLDLSYNNISEVEPFTRLCLRNLSQLRLAGNPLDVFQLLEVSDVRPRSLDFSGLQLDASAMGEVCRRLAGPQLRLLRLNRNGITALPDGALSPCPPIAALDLTGNRLRRLGCAGRLLDPQQLPVLAELTVEHNLLRRLPSCAAAPVLRRLWSASFRFNRILVAGPHAFANTPRLRLLRLDVNGLAWLHRDAFRGLRQLRVLRLDNNLLTDLYPGSFADLGRLSILNLRNNRVSVLFPGAFAGLRRLQTLDLGGNNLRHLAAAALEGLQGLRRLYLDRNRLQEVSAQPFAPVQASLGVLDLRANSLRYISRRELRHPPFKQLRRLYDLKLQAQQPYGLRIIPHRFFQGLTALRSLYLAQNRLLAVPSDAFDDLGQLRYLTLADSSGGMGDLPPGVFKNLSRLRCLDLENAGLRSLGPEVLGNLSRLERLKLAKNNLQTLERALDTQLPALRYLDLRKCPLSCGCANSWLPAWLNRTAVQVVYLYNYTCGGSGGGGYLHSFDTRVCYPEAGLYLFAITTPAVVLLLVLPPLYRRLYWRLRYRLYLLRAWVKGRWRREAQRYAYDAFVSYNSADEGWVLGELVPELEGGSLRLCLHHRDFQPGRTILDNIVEGIYSSRKTVCVVSRGFLRSEWCSLEIQLATYRLFEESRDVLVLVFLEEVPQAELAAYHRMRRVLLRRTYLRWPEEPPAQKLFWERLKRALRSGDGGEERGEREEGEEGEGGE